MKRTEHPPAPKAKTLAQQKDVFTSEGAPPPGKVATEVPVSAPRTPRRPPPKGRQAGRDR